MPTETVAAGEYTGWRCPYTHKLFLDTELVGYGNPPRSPACPPGTGQGAPMTPVRFTVDPKGVRTLTDKPIF